MQLVAAERSACQAVGMSILTQDFFARPALELAPEILGKVLFHGPVKARITEVEAYAATGDSANHCFRGRTARNLPMWGPPGHAYVYLCYGLHHLLNVVSDLEGQGAAVLIRSVEVLEGLDTVAQRRGGRRGVDVGAGPGKVGALLGIDRSWSRHPLFETGDLELHDAPLAEQFLCGPRVGIGYADAQDQRALWRFALTETAAVSQKKSLRPWRMGSGRLS
jgi:DNA-3-methyladenine glycosylase